MPALRQSDDHRGHPGTAGDREGPRAPASEVAGTLTSASLRPGAAKGLTPPRCDRSGDPAPWARSGQLRQRVCGTDGGGLGKRDSPESAPEKQDLRGRCQHSTHQPAVSKDRLKPVGCRVRGSIGTGKRAFEHTISALFNAQKRSFRQLACGVRWHQQRRWPSPQGPGWSAPALKCRWCRSVGSGRRHHSNLS